MKVAIYARVSTEDQYVNKQVDLCTEWVERHGYDIYKTYTDVISGAKASRPSFNKLLDDMRHYKFRMVIVTKLDHLGRSLQQLIGFLD